MALNLIPSLLGGLAAGIFGKPKKQAPPGIFYQESYKPCPPGSYLYKYSGPNRNTAQCAPIPGYVPPQEPITIIVQTPEAPGVPTAMPSSPPPDALPSSTPSAPSVPVPSPATPSAAPPPRAGDFPLYISGNVDPQFAMLPRSKAKAARKLPVKFEDKAKFDAHLKAIRERALLDRAISEKTRAKLGTKAPSKPPPVDFKRQRIGNQQPTGIFGGLSGIGVAILGGSILRGDVARDPKTGKIRTDVTASRRSGVPGQRARAGSTARPAGTAGRTSIRAANPAPTADPANRAAIGTASPVLTATTSAAPAGSRTPTATAKKPAKYLDELLAIVKDPAFLISMAPLLFAGGGKKTPAAATTSVPSINIQLPQSPSAAPTMAPQPLPTFFAQPFGGGVPFFPSVPRTDRCDCAPKKKRKPSKPRAVCYRGTYIEKSRGLIKQKREPVPCQ